MIQAKIGNRTFQYNSKLESYFQKFRKGIIGLDQRFKSPYGEKKIIYTDWTASGRLYRPIEEKITNEIGPFMANTHTESNMTGSFMTTAYHHAKQVIKNHVNADEHDVILLEGSGMTSVTNKLQRILGLKVPEKYKNQVTLSESDTPIIFITHLEHHSNHTSWLETLGEVVIIPPDSKGMPDFNKFDHLLKKYKHRKYKIGSFSACSNVTGIKPPYHLLVKKMHEHGGLGFVDFSASAPYVEIDMHPEDPLEKLDAVFFSPHKFLGGPGSSGVVVFDSRLYSNKVPDHPGGGTVTWTNPWGEHHYFKDIETREDGGTPGILQGIRAALAIKLKEKMGVKNILQREEELLSILLPGLKGIPGVHVFEEDVEDRLGIVSFYVDDIHYNLVVKLLSDRFGYQVRGGCSCAGTYGHYLYHLDKEKSKAFTDMIDQGDQSTKPGWVRVSVHPTMTNEEVYGFIQAIKLIKVNSHEWAKDYRYDPSSNDYFYIKHKQPPMERVYQV